MTRLKQALVEWFACARKWPVAVQEPGGAVAGGVVGVNPLKKAGIASLASYSPKLLHQKLHLAIISNEAIATQAVAAIQIGIVVLFS